MLGIPAVRVKKTAVTRGNFALRQPGILTWPITNQSTDLHLLPFSGLDSAEAGPAKSTLSRVRLGLGSSAADRHDERMPASVPSAPWLILGARFHAVVVDRLVDGARSCLLQKGVPAAQVTIQRVAGAFELPQLAAAWAAVPPALRPAGIVALGCVVRGDTPHFEYVCAEASRGLMDVALRSGVPLGFGLLTCDTLQQALDRAGGSHGDKGWDAAEAAWDLAGRIADARGRPEQAPG